MQTSPATYEAPKYVVALVGHVQAKIARVYWGSSRTVWDGSTDPAIAGVAWSVQTMPDTVTETRLGFEQAELLWNPRSLQSMRANVSWTSAEWVAWFDRLMLAIDNQGSAL